MKFALAAALIYWMIRSGLLNLDVFRLVLQPTYLFLCFFLVGANLFLATIRWHVLLRAQNLQLPLWSVYKLTMIGVFFNFAIPGGVSGDLVKAYYLIMDDRSSRLAPSMTILVDRLAGMFSMLLMAIIVVSLSIPLALEDRRLQVLFIGVAAIFALFVGFVVLVYSRRIRDSRRVNNFIDRWPAATLLYRVYDSFHLYVRRPRALILAVLLSILAHSCMVLFFIMIAAAMNMQDIPILAYLFSVPLGLISTTIPVVPAGIGVGQAAFSALFNLYIGNTIQLGATGITVWQVFTLILATQGVVFYLRHRVNVRLT